MPMRNESVYAFVSTMPCPAQVAKLSHYMNHIIKNLELHTADSTLQDFKHVEI